MIQSSFSGFSTSYIKEEEVSKNKFAKKSKKRKANETTLTRRTTADESLLDISLVASVCHEEFSAESGDLIRCGLEGDLQHVHLLVEAASLMLFLVPQQSNVSPVPNSPMLQISEIVNGDERTTFTLFMRW